MWYAAKNRSSEMVKLLVDAERGPLDSNQDRIDGDGLTALYKASKDNNFSEV